MARAGGSQTSRHDRVGPSRAVSIAQHAQLVLADLTRDRRSVFGERPLRQIDPPPFFYSRERRENGLASALATCARHPEARTSDRLGVDEPGRPFGIEPRHQNVGLATSAPRCGIFLDIAEWVRGGFGV
jgi:hypothetical protein